MHHTLTGILYRMPIFQNDIAIEFLRIIIPNFHAKVFQLKPKAVIFTHMH